MACLLLGDGTSRRVPSLGCTSGVVELSSRPNKLCLWRDSVLYLGDSFDPELHSHHAVQCCIALDGEFQIRAQEHENPQSCSSAVIGADIPHAIANPDGPLCIIYLEKTSSDYRSILDFHGISHEGGLRANPLLFSAAVSESLRNELTSAFSTELSSSQANDLREACLQLFRGHFSTPNALDPRISDLLGTLHERPDLPFAGKILAARVGLSESRMQHLFKEQVGIPIRRYVLWMRLRNVIELAVMDSSLTEAAHASGFADLAHFSRTFRAMFGIKPSALLAGRDGLVPLMCDRT